MGIKTFYNSAVNVSLEEYDNHIWVLNIYENVLTPSEINSILSSQEILKGEAFKDETQKKRYYLTRFYLRLILSQYLKCFPQELTFEPGFNGKPFLSNILYNNHHNLYFNVSHSENIVVIAVSLNLDIGVDIEHINFDLDWEEISAITLSKNEQKNLSTLQEKKGQLKEFYKIWTCKEAFLKATGIGLFYPPSKLEIIFSNYMKKEDQRGKEHTSNINWNIYAFEYLFYYMITLATQHDLHKLKFIEVTNWNINYYPHLCFIGGGFASTLD